MVKKLNPIKTLGVLNNKSFKAGESVLDQKDFF
jgi:hypothetical protein